MQGASIQFQFHAIKASNFIAVFRPPYRNKFDWARGSTWSTFCWTRSHKDEKSLYVEILLLSMYMYMYFNLFTPTESLCTIVRVHLCGDFNKLRI